MKIRRTLLLILALISGTFAFYSCAPFPSFTNPGDSSAASVAEQELKKYKRLPTGHPDPHGRKNMIVSPYSPYNIIDITGYSSGDVVGDPSTGKINPTTGRIDINSCKSFRIP